MTSLIIDPRILRIGNILLYKEEPVHITSLTLDIDDEYQESIGFCKIGRDTDEIYDWNRAFANDLRRLSLSSQLLAGLFGPEVGLFLARISFVSFSSHFFNLL